MSTLLLQKLRPPAAAPVVRRDLALEGLRGACALLVFYAHLFLPIRVLDPGWAPPPAFSWFNLGRPAVLFFFVLSGYVIGLVTTVPATGAGVRQYLFHRMARLLPISTFAVVLSWLLAPTAGKILVVNLLLLQNSDPYPFLGVLPTLVNNPNLWSLNYEAVYYLGFILLWFRPQRVGFIFLSLLLVLAAHATGLPVPRFLAAYATGAFYWVGGLTVAWMTTLPVSPEIRSNWPAALLTAYALWKLSLLHTLLSAAGLTDWMWTAWSLVSPHELDFLPVSLWVLLAATGRAPRAQRILTWSCLGLATAGLAVRLGSGQFGAAEAVATTSLVVAWFMSRQDCGLPPLRWLAPVGAISYAIYALASPLQLGQRALWRGFSRTALTFASRWVVVVAVVIAAAWLLERRICPPLSRWIRHWGQPRPAARV